MLNGYRLQITTPKGVIFDESVYELSLRAADGDLSILPGHIPLCTATLPCEVKIYDREGNKSTGRIEGGILLVTEEKTQLLSSSFEWNDIQSK